MTTARELAQRFGLHRLGREWRGNCPACGYKDALSVTERGERVLWTCAACRDQAALTAALSGQTPGAPMRKAPDPRHRGDAARALWQRSRPDPLIARYLAERGIPSLPVDAPLRLLSDAKHPEGRRWPAMIALLHGAYDRPVAVHRTFLQPDGRGKAEIEPQRMTLGPVHGAAVRLYQAAPRLVIGEGIETALSAAILLDAPAWAAVSAGNLANGMILPACVREVIIAADNDPAGREAARAGARRWRAEGRKVRIAVPDRPGLDFNDLLRARRAPHAG